MSGKFVKWSTEYKQNPEDPLRVVLFTARNKDNREIENFRERRVSFLYHIPESEDDRETAGVILNIILNKKFQEFVDAGQPGELSRLYVSVNKRNPDKIKKQLMHLLIDDELPGRTPLTHLESIIAGIAAKKECAAERRWLWDVDIDNEETVHEFELMCKNILEIDSKGKTTPNVKTYTTINGYAIVCDRGFDIRKLTTEQNDLISKGLITLKKDDLLLVDWKSNEPTIQFIKETN